MRILFAEQRGAGRIHAKDAGTAADVENDLVAEDVRILVYRVSVTARADFIFLVSHVCQEWSRMDVWRDTHQHLLVYAMVVVGLVHGQHPQVFTITSQRTLK